MPNKDTDSGNIPEKENTNKKKIIFRRIDITDANQIGSLFKDYQFDLVFHLVFLWLIQEHVKKTLILLLM